MLDIFDRTNRLCLAAFGTPAEYVRGADKVPIRGVYDSNYMTLDPNTGVPIMSCTPVFAVSDSDIPGGRWQEGDKVIIGGVIFSADEPHNDSEGMTELVLRRESLR